MRHTPKEKFLYQDTNIRSGGFKPGGWEIKKSPIHGKGVFACKQYDDNEPINLCFIIKNYVNKDRLAPSESLIRTTFGAYINHSDEPNTELIKKGLYYILKAIKQINVGDEMTCSYNTGEAYKISGGFPNPD